MFCRLDKKDVSSVALWGIVCSPIPVLICHADKVSIEAQNIRDARNVAGQCVEGLMESTPINLCTLHVSILQVLLPNDLITL